jgi:hypothetical protein
MELLQVVELTPSHIRLNNTLTELASDQYIRIQNGKQIQYAKVSSLNQHVIAIPNSDITNLEDWKFKVLDTQETVISNPLLLGNQVNQFGQIADNKKIYSLSLPTKKTKKIQPSEFYISPSETIQSEFVFFGLYADNNLKSLIEVENNNAKNYVFMHLTPNKPNNQNGVKFLKLLEKFNLRKKNIFLQIDGASNIKLIRSYMNYFQDNLSQNTLVIINSNDWTDQEMFELNWALGRTPKLILLHSEQERKIKQFCSAIIGDE